MKRMILLPGVTGLLLLVAAGPAAAQTPFQVEDRITDEAGVLSGATEQQAVEGLETDSGIALYVVTVDDFEETTGDDWAQRTFEQSALGSSDVLLALAADQVAYEWWLGDDVEVDDLETVMGEDVEPAVLDERWTDAVVAAAGVLRSGSLAPDVSPKAAPEAAPDAEAGWSTGTALAIVGGVAVVLVGGHLLSRKDRPAGAGHPTGGTGSGGS